MLEPADRIAELQREVEMNPSSRQFYQLGELLRREGRAEEAVNVLHAGLLHHPRYVAAWVSLGRALIELAQAEAATKVLGRAIELDTQNPVAWRLLGEARLVMGNRLGALSAMQKALEIAPGDEMLLAAVEALAGETAPPAPLDEMLLPGPTLKRPVAAVPPAPPEEPPTPANWERPPAAPVAMAASAEAAPKSHREARRAVAPGGFETRPGVQVPVAPGFFEAPPAPFEELLEPFTLAAPPALGSDDVFADAFAVAAPPQPAPPPVVVEEEVAPEPVAEVREAAAPPAVAPAVAPAEEAPAPPMFAEPPVPPVAAIRPTVALARIYIQREEFQLAVETLEGVLRRDPSHQEARDLLALVQEMMTAPAADVLPPLPLRERKIAALQRWMASLTLGQERLGR